MDKNIYVFPMAENFSLMMENLALITGVHFTGHVVQKFKLSVVIASLFYRCGKPHGDAAKYLINYVDQDTANYFIDYWTYQFANYFKAYMIFVIDEREECDVSIDEEDNVVVYVKSKPTAKVDEVDLAKRLLMEADENMDYIPESVRTALERLR